MSELSPLIGDLTLGGVGGFCIGYAIKKLLKLLALIFGTGFLGIQFLASKKLITIHYEILGDWGASLLHKVSDLQMSFAPLGVAFVGGLTLGLKKG